MRWASVGVGGGGRWVLAHSVWKRRGLKQQPDGSICSPVWARASVGGPGGPSMGTRRAIPHRGHPPALRQARGEVVAGAVLAG